VPRRKGISPVIATVIIVAVTIAVAIAVAFWMTGIVGLFTAVEKLEIVSATATAGTNQWTITIVAKNTGTTQTSVDVIFVNGINATQLTCGTQQVDVTPTPPQVIRPGEQLQFTITIYAGACQVDGNTVFTASPGVSIEVKLHSTGGKEYPKLLTLP
jgi:flagellin-like protein